jgi:hypothetical protein
MPIKCPAFDFLTPEQEALENVDTREEKDFGEIKRKERIVILQSDMAPVVTGPKRSSKKGSYVPNLPIINENLRYAPSGNEPELSLYSRDPLTGRFSSSCSWLSAMEATC